MRPAVALHAMPCRLLCALATLTALAGCGDDDTGAATCAPPMISAARTPLPAEVDAILESRCRTCHSDPPQNYAPFPLVRWEDLHAPSPSDENENLYEVVARRIDDERFPMPPARQPQLTEAQRQVLRAWIADCAPPGTDFPGDDADAGE